MSPGDITPYTALITSEHNQQPDFMTTVAALLQPFADQIVTADSMPTLFDVYNAEGQQLDFVGEWVGASRQVIIDQPGIYFSFDTVGLGFDQAVFGDGSGGGGSILITLDDDTFRLLILAKIASNNWDGTIPGAYIIFNTLFEPFGYTLKIYDDSAIGAFSFDTPLLGFDEGIWEGDEGGVMTMRLELDSLPTVAPPSKLLIALFKSGFLDIRPSGVRITSYLINGAVV